MNIDFMLIDLTGLDKDTERNMAWTDFEDSFSLVIPYSFPSFIILADLSFM